MLFAIDFETAPIEPGLQAPPPVCMSLATFGVDAQVLLAAEALDMLETLLRDPDAHLTNGNIAFDLAVACQERPHLFDLVFAAYDADRIHDVLNRQKLIDIALGEHRHHGKYNMATVTQRLCGRELAKGENTWRKRYWELVSVPLVDWPPEAVAYSLEDARAALDCHTAQDAGLAEVGQTAVLADECRQNRADFALKLASAWGLRTDREAVRRLRAACEARQTELRDELLNAGLLARDSKGEISRKVRKAQARLFELNPKARLTEKGQELQIREVQYISVDAEACQDSGDDLLEHYGEYTQLGSMLSGPMKTIEGGVDAPIHTHFEVLLDTGRTSSSAPPLQNLSRKEGVREAFVPRPGYDFVGCDFDKAELHTLAQCCLDLFGHSSLAEALNDGYDPHTGLGARLAHTTYDELKARIAAGDETAKEWRQRAKPGNFGFPGGMGAVGMKAYAKSTCGVVMTLQESEHLYAGWQEQWPEVSGEYLAWIRELTSATGFATIEHFVSHRWRGHVPYCAAANSFFQGRCADGMKAALWEVTKLCYTPGTVLYGCRPVNEVHDEIIIEAPQGRASEAAWLMRDTMVAAYNRFTPDVPVRSTPVRSDHWSKKAKTIVAPDGRLELWRYAA